MPKTTEQLASLIESRGESLKTITLNVDDLISSPEMTDLIVSDAADLAGDCIVNGRDVLVMTSRKLVTGDDGISSLKIGSAVAAALVLFLRMLIPRPRYIIAKVSCLTSTKTAHTCRDRCH